MTEHKPPERPYIAYQCSIFLAGSIEQGTAEDWQKRVVEQFKDIPVTFLNPRRENWDAAWAQSIDNQMFNEQVNWELDYIQSVGHVFMYFAPGTQSPISLVEFGLMIKKKNMIVVCPKGFWRKGNVDIMCQREGIPSFGSLEQGVAELKKRVMQEIST